MSLGVLFLIYQRPEITGQHYLADGFWQDAIEELPDESLILVRDIKKALNGEPFGFFPKGEKKIKYVDAVDFAAFSHYHTIYKYSQKFGLPNGSGWANELPWVPQFLSYFDDLKANIEAWHIRKNSKKAR